jgi:antitoxin (DNA-binding transcriptional repressor) of toxin-antitoxin stability system
MADLAHERRSKPPIQPDRPVRTSGADVSSSAEDALRKRVAELEAENAELGKGMKELSADNAVQAKMIAELRSAKAGQDAKITDQGKQIADLKMENASLNREFDDLKDQNAERERKDAARDAKIAELETGLGELHEKREDDRSEEQPAARIADRGRADPGEDVERAESSDRWRLPSDAVNNVISVLAGGAITDVAYHFRELSPEVAGIGATGVAAIVGFVAVWREHRRAKKDADHRPEG